MLGRCPLQNPKRLCWGKSLHLAGRARESNRPDLRSHPHTPVTSGHSPLWSGFPSVSIPGESVMPLTSPHLHGKEHISVVIFLLALGGITDSVESHNERGQVELVWKGKGETRKWVHGQEWPLRQQKGNARKLRLDTWSPAWMTK